MLKKVTGLILSVALFTLALTPLTLKAQEIFYAELTVENLSYTYQDYNKHNTRAVPQDKIKLSVTLENKSQTDIKNLNIELVKTEGIKIENKKTTLETLKPAEKKIISFEGILEKKDNLSKITPVAEISSESTERFSTNEVNLTVNTPQIELGVKENQNNNELNYEITYRNTGATSAFDPQLKLTLEGPANFVSTSQAATSLQPKNIVINLPKHYSEQSTSTNVKVNLTSREKVTLKLETTFKDLNNTSYSAQKTVITNPQLIPQVKSQEDIKAEEPPQSSEPQIPITEDKAPVSSETDSHEFIPPDEGVNDEIPDREETQTENEDKKDAPLKNSADRSTRIITILIIVFAVILAILIGSLIYINYYEKKKLED